MKTRQDKKGTQDGYRGQQSVFRLSYLIRGFRNNVCVVIPFILDVKLVDAPAVVTGFLIHLPSAVLTLIFTARRIQPFLSLVDREIEFCVCVCVCFLPIHSGHQVRWTYQPGSHRISHPPSFCGACLNFSREKDSAIPSLVDRDVEFCVLTI